ncbi:MAG: transposase [Planctomycetota bacterium]
MVNKRNYRRISVNQIQPVTLRERALELGDRSTCVGLDIGKNEIVSVIRWPCGQFERPWSVKNPDQIQAFIERMLILKETCDSLRIGLESTGTYGDCVRKAMTDAKLEVHRVAGKATSDYKEIFDGVPSAHDGKDAAIIAELSYFQKSTPWPYVPPAQVEDEILYDVIRYSLYCSEKSRYLNRIEAMLARHWPELRKSLELTSLTLLEICDHYGSPARLADDDEADQRLRRWSRGRLKRSTIETIVESARSSVGLPMSAAALDWMSELATESKRCRKNIKKVDVRLNGQAAKHEQMRRFHKPVGGVSLCAIWSTVGDPARYDSSGAFVKALGLNLKELSSGKRSGQLAITKRGNSHARKILFFWALRAVQRPELQGWYAQFKRVGRDQSGHHRNSEKRKMKGIVALMRRLAAGLWYARTHDEDFDFAKVFPGSPLIKSRRGANRQSPACVA